MQGEQKEEQNCVQNSSYERKQMIDEKIYVKNVENAMEVDKVQKKEYIHTEAVVQRERILADISAEKELKRMYILVSGDGEIFLHKEQFYQDIKGKLPIQILAARRYSHFNDAEPSALTVILKKTNGVECVLFWNLNKLEKKYIRKPFVKNGITFGFGEKKEDEVRMKLVQSLINMSKIYALPECHGWYETVNGGVRYAFPKDLTWKEVNEKW